MSQRIFVTLLAAAMTVACGAGAYGVSRGARESASAGARAGTAAGTGAFIGGTVIDGRNHQRVSQALVHFYSMGPGNRSKNVGSLRTSLDGSFVFSLKPGQYHVFAAHPRLASTQTIVTVAPGQKANIVLALSSRPVHHAHQRFHLGVGRPRL